MQLTPPARVWVRRAVLLQVRLPEARVVLPVPVPLHRVAQVAQVAQVIQAVQAAQNQEAIWVGQVRLRHRVAVRIVQAVRFDRVPRQPPVQGRVMRLAPVRQREERLRPALARSKKIPVLNRKVATDQTALSSQR